ncbi:MAG: hypothetical protein A2V98_13985 [Planctomycetes bacterium RBG_16_64_12]|nr:MAG: hypothetical protein A2V98_13985 [Planctomycetes bacterium RBG_16_64_12]
MAEASALQAKRPWLTWYEPGVPYTLEYPDFSVADFLIQAYQQWPQRTAIIFRRRRFTYAELYANAARMAGVLRGLGVQPSDRVAIMLPNCPQFVIALFGALFAGAIVVPTSPLYTAREAMSQLNNAGAKVVIALRRHFPMLSEIADAVGLRHVITTPLQETLPLPDRWLFPLVARSQTDARDAENSRFHRWGRVMKQFPPIDDPFRAKPGDLAVLQFTGGTTGLSKGAMLTHRNLVANCLQIRNWFARDERRVDVYLGAIPFFHIYGLTVVVLSTVSIGAAVVHIDRFDVNDVVRAIRKHRPTVFHGVPTMYVAINRAAEKWKVDFSCIETCMSGSAPLPLGVQKRFEELTKGKLVEGYGLTEASPVTHVNPLGATRKIGSIGVPIPDTECKIVDPVDPSRELPVGEGGELALRGPQVMQGYWQAPEETTAVLRDGWLYTGDIARMDEDGFFYIVDRKKDMILVGGFNVYPREVEEVLVEHPSVAEAVVVGVPDEYRGEAVKAFVVPKDGTVVDEEELRTFARRRLAPYKVFRILEVRQSMPKTAVGKVLRRLLREGKA